MVLVEWSISHSGRGTFTSCRKDLRRSKFSFSFRSPPRHVLYEELYVMILDEDNASMDSLSKFSQIKSGPGSNEKCNGRSV